jgi:hypothetical protein
LDWVENVDKATGNFPKREVERLTGQIRRGPQLRSRQTRKDKRHPAIENSFNFFVTRQGFGGS